jgi:hypothetical protein
MEYSSLLFPPFPVDAIEGCRDLTCLSREQGLRAKHLQNRAIQRSLTVHALC